MFSNSISLREKSPVHDGGARMRGGPEGYFIIRKTGLPVQIRKRREYEL